MTTFLADGNVLIALTVTDHIHHAVAVDWCDATDADLATCPITEGTLLRFLLCEGQSTGQAIGLLEALRAQPWHRFWTDSLPYRREQLGGVIGHRQITDAYLVALTTEHHSQLATFDRGLAALHGNHVHLLSGRQPSHWPPRSWRRQSPSTHYLTTCRYGVLEPLRPF